MAVPWPENAYKDAHARGRQGGNSRGEGILSDFEHECPGFVSPQVILTDNIGLLWSGHYSIWLAAR